MAAFRTTLGARFNRLANDDSPAKDTILSRTNACKASRQILVSPCKLHKPWQHCTSPVRPPSPEYTTLRLTRNQGVGAAPPRALLPEHQRPLETLAAQPGPCCLASVARSIVYSPYLLSTHVV